MDQRVEMIDGILGEAAVGRETVCPVPFLVITVILAVIEAGSVHPHAASLTASAAGVYLDGDAIPDGVFVDTRPELDHGAHIFVARREILVEGEAAPDPCGQTFGDDLHVRAADGDRVDPDQNLGWTRFRDGLFREPKLFGIVEDPCLHGLGNGEAFCLR